MTFETFGPEGEPLVVRLPTNEQVERLATCLAAASVHQDERRDEAAVMAARTDAVRQLAWRHLVFALNTEVGK